MTEEQKEDIKLLKELIADTSIPNDEREIYQEALNQILAQTKSDMPKEAKKKMPKKEKATPKAKASKKPKAEKPTALPSDVDAMKKAIKERTGKTEAECEDIIAQYRKLRAKAKVNSAKRTERLKSDDKLIAGTNVITPVAQIEKDAEIVKAKIEKQVEQIENKAEREVVKKDKTKDEVKVEVEQKVVKQLAKLSDDMVLSATTFVKNIQTELKKVDKTEAKNFLLGLRNEIDALLSKFGDGGGISKFDNGGEVKKKIVKKFDGYYEDYRGEHVVSLVKEEDGSGYYFLDTTNGYAEVFKEKSRTKNALERYVRKNYMVVSKFGDGGTTEIYNIAEMNSSSVNPSKFARGGGVDGKTYEIKGADVTFYEDSYADGELDQFHSYYLNQTEFPYKTKFSSKQELFDTLNEFISYADLKEDDFFIDEDTIQTSALVKYEKGSDWDEFSAPTEKEKELWRKGKMKLYSAQFVFPYEVYKKEKLEFAKGGMTKGGSLFEDNFESEYNSMSKNDKEELMRETIGVGRTPFSEYENYNQLSDYHKELVDNYFTRDYKKMADGGGVKSKTNSQRIKALVENLDNTPYSIGLAILRERLLTYTQNDLRAMEKFPDSFDNPIISRGMYKDYFNRVIEELKFDYEDGGSVDDGDFADGGSVDEKYKVVKVFRKSGRREVLEKNLTLEQARRVVERYPNSNTSMVVFMKMYSKGGGVGSDGVRINNGYLYFPIEEIDYQLEQGKIKVGDVVNYVFHTGYHTKYDPKDSRVLLGNKYKVVDIKIAPLSVQKVGQAQKREFIIEQISGLKNPMIKDFVIEGKYAESSLIKEDVVKSYEKNNDYARGGGVKGKDNRAKKVIRNVNGFDREYPIKDAWRKEHNQYNKSEKHEIPTRSRK
jgi:hypothetical protein